ncbi:MAG TPA: TIGR03862 family flavoprotein [Cytophagaceae bacterium]|jgi:uncharacterized flavoprotein (TIGR03862 family)|nr:TIGR03862 family flavoprotein [Cytophagaceae bacterium]
MKKSIAIVGSGPSALMLAISLDKSLYEVTIYERNFAPGRKFLVAGDGGFNLTHSENIEAFITRYTPGNFLEKCLRHFTNIDLRDWLTTIGIDTYVGTSKRIFPVKGIKPIDVLNAILTEVKNNNVQIKTQHDWIGWNSDETLLINYKEEAISVKADFVIFALGGASWSKTGSDGTWLPLFHEKKIETVPFQASNCAFEIKWPEPFIEQANGKALKNISVTCDDKENKGELVITKFGIEGGVVYALSPVIRELLRKENNVSIFIDLKPTHTLSDVQTKLRARGNKSYTKLLKDALHLDEVQIGLLKTILSKEEFTDLDTLACKIKQLPLSITAMGPIEDAISAVGGISLNEVDSFYQLKKLPRHYVIGEMLDWDAPTGGYLLQACFSMGRYLACKLNKDTSSC